MNEADRVLFTAGVALAGPRCRPWPCLALEGSLNSDKAAAIGRRRWKLLKTYFLFTEETTEREYPTKYSKN